MAKNTQPVLKRCRTLGVSPAAMGYSKSSNKKPGGMRRTKKSEYGLQLQEKQKAKYTYGVLERQFRRYYVEANRQPGKTGDNLVVLLETRLDNVVYRAGLARTRRQARQLVSHGHFTVNGKKTNVPSYRVSQYDIIDIRERSQKMEWFEEAQDRLGEAVVPAWLQVVPESLRILVHQLPERAQIDVPLQEQLIVELYSK